MKCEQIRALMMDYLYNELSNEDRDSFNSHLAHCDDCRKKAKSLKTTSNILQQWEDVDPENRVIPLRDKPSRMMRFRNFVLNRLPKPRKVAIGFAYGFTGIFLLLAITNTEISVKDGNFTLRMGLLSRPEPQENQNDLYAQQLVEQLLNENIQLTRSLVQESEVRQRKELAYVVSALQKDIEHRRYQDLNLVGYGLNNIQKNTSQQIQQIDHTLSELVRADNVKY